MFLLIFRCAELMGMKKLLNRIVFSFSLCGLLSCLFELGLGADLLSAPEVVYCLILLLVVAEMRSPKAKK